jgi:DNA helicase-2/ATP-dependent DNA helicase PcrA
MAAAYDTRPGDFVKDLGGALDKAAAANFGRHQDGVALLTYLRAKGRQWHTVMIAGVSEGVLPRAGAPIEDERRLFYTAMTRASSNLVISSVGRVCSTPVATSRFVAEAGLDEGVRVETGRR